MGHFRLHWILKIQTDSILQFYCYIPDELGLNHMYMFTFNNCIIYVLVDVKFTSNRQIVHRTEIKMGLYSEFGPLRGGGALNKKVFKSQAYVSSSKQ